MVLTFIWLDYLIIIGISLAFIGALVYLIISKKKGKPLGCSNCPLNGSCHKNIEACQKETKSK